MILSRLVVRESGLESGLNSVFAGLGVEQERLGLRLGLGLGKICNQVHFQFSLCTFCSVLLRPYDILQTRIVYTTKDLCYLLNI